MSTSINIVCILEIHVHVLKWDLTLKLPNFLNGIILKNVHFFQQSEINYLFQVITHETCHLFGLQHCWYFQCTMNESNSMQEAASQPIFLCPVCLRKLQHCCGFDVLSRYKKMLLFFQDISDIYPTPEFIYSVKWLEKCIKFLEINSDVR